MDSQNILTKQVVAGSIGFDQDPEKNRKQDNDDNSINVKGDPDINIKKEVDTLFVSIGIEQDYDEINTQEEDYAKSFQQDDKMNVKEETDICFVTGCDMNLLTQEAFENVSSIVLISL